MTGMVEFYVRKIKDSNGEFGIENVPRLWRERVRAHLDGKANEDGQNGT